MTEKRERDELCELYRRHALDVRSGAASVLGCTAEQDGVVHEVFLRLLRSGEYPSGRRAGAFFYTAGRNAALNRQRRYERQVEDPEAALATVPTPTSQCPEVLLTRKRVRESVHQVLAELPHRCRTVAELSYIEGLSCREIAEHLGIGVKQVEKQRAKARKHALDRLTVQLDEPPEGGGTADSCV